MRCCVSEQKIEARKETSQSSHVGKYHTVRFHYPSSFLFPLTRQMTGPVTVKSASQSSSFFRLVVATACFVAARAIMTRPVRRSGKKLLLSFVLCFLLCLSLLRVLLRAMLFVLLRCSSILDGWFYFFSPAIAAREVVQAFGEASSKRLSRVLSNSMLHRCRVLRLAWKIACSLLLC